MDSFHPARRPVREILVGISDLAISNDPDSALSTHNLGSCIAVSVHDRVARIGGLLHYLLPLSSERSPHVPFKPEMFADTGVPLLFERMYALGAVKSRMTVKVVGGAKVNSSTAATPIQIGARNFMILRKMFWQNQVIITAEDVGGTEPRSVRLDVGTGTIVVTTLRGERAL